MSLVSASTELQDYLFNDIPEGAEWAAQYLNSEHLGWKNYKFPATKREAIEAFRALKEREFRDPIRVVRLCRYMVDGDPEYIAFEITHYHEFK